VLSKKNHTAPPWQVILEEIRSGSRATIEAVEASHDSLERQIHELRRDHGARLDKLDAAVASNRRAILANRKALDANREAIEGQLPGHRGQSGSHRGHS